MKEERQDGSQTKKFKMLKEIVERLGGENVLLVIDPDTHEVQQAFVEPSPQEPES